MNPICVSTWGDSRKYFNAFIETARRNGIEPVNADDTNWPGKDWTEIEWWRKSAAQLKFAMQYASKYSHILFCDSYDVVFAAGWDEIIEKYERLNSPIVFAAECYPWPLANQADLYPPTAHRCKYLNAGAWIATPDAASELLKDIEVEAAKRIQCDQGIAVDMFLSKQHPIVLDSACSICFCCNIDSLSYLDLRNRPRTMDTGQEPCLFHGNGGSDLSGIIKSLTRWRPTPEEVERMAE